MRNLRMALTAVAILAAGSARAQSGGGGGGGPGGTAVKATASFVYLSDESTQGGDDLPGGTTMYSVFGVQYYEPKFLSGLGLIYEMNQVGKTQEETAIGLKIEISHPAFPVYFEMVPYSQVTQTFTDRSIETREGSMNSFGLGARSTLLPWLFLDGCFRSRSTTYNKEDGKSMSRPVVRKERLPYLGFGVMISI